MRFPMRFSGGMTVRRFSRGLSAATAAAVLATVAACAVGPDYHLPPVDVAPAYKEAGDWKPSKPSDAMTRGPWWEIYNDATLNQLEAQINISNENVKAAAAAFDQARALVAQARAGFWPTAGISAGQTRGASGGGPAHIADSAGISGTWLLDVWGQVRRTVESNVAAAQSSAALLASTQLSAQAFLAIDYFLLRTQDQLQKLLDDTVKAYELSLKIAESRYHYGVGAKADVVLAQSQLLSSQAQQVNASIQRAVLEHAIAVLIGQQPASFSLPVTYPLRTDVPTVPAGVPSTLLERRPDVAEAERKVAAANAQIGVAKAAFFPSLTLSGSNDFTSPGPWSRLLNLPNRVWSIGPSLAETVIDGGLRRAQVAQARAAYEVTVDTYRQTVLTGFQQVEDNIVTLRVLEKQAIIEDAAVAAARLAESLTLNQYKAGTVPYSSVILAQTASLSTEQTALAVLSTRLQTSVALIEALGGGWDTSMLPAVRTPIVPD